MRTLAIGDIHGTSRALELLLDQVRPESDDQLIVLGDMIDRGPDSKAVIDRLIRLQHETSLVALCGNHEEMLLNAGNDPGELDMWLYVGGAATLRSYGCNSLDPNEWDIPADHWTFLKSLLDYYETKTHLFCHGTPDPDTPLSQQIALQLRWQKWHKPQPHVSGKTLVCGHTAAKDGNPINLGHSVCIDTFAYGGQWLSCLDCDSGFVVQTNQRGEKREAHLDQFLETRSKHDFFRNLVASVLRS